VRAIVAVLALFVGMVILSGCGGGSPDAATGAPADGATTEPTVQSTSDASTAPNESAAAPSAPTAAGELPKFMSDFDRVCETQVGFGGAAAYDTSPGIHPVVLLYDYGDPPTLITSSLTLPAGWAVTEDTNYEDNTELAAAQLVACSRRTAATPNGTMCDFTLNDGGTVTLELTDTVYELTVYGAATGDQVGEPTTLEAATTECPYFASFREGDTRYLNSPSEDQYVNALKDLVAP
jgi:hypothetical protein